MDAIRYLKERKRMCDYSKKLANSSEETLKSDCDYCPFDEFGTEYTLGCYIAEVEYPEDAVNVVEEWSEENKQKTNAQKFEEVFGFSPFSEGGSLNLALTQHVDYGLSEYGRWFDEPYEEHDNVRSGTD